MWAELKTEDEAHLVHQPYVYPVMEDRLWIHLEAMDKQGLVWPTVRLKAVMYVIETITQMCVMIL